MERPLSFSVLFYLCKTKTNRNGEVPITLRLTVNGERKEMRIHRFIDPKQRDAAKRGANRSCKALNLSLDTINLRRFAHIESWIRQGNTLSLKRDRIVIWNKMFRMPFLNWNIQSTQSKINTIIIYLPVSKVFEERIRYCKTTSEEHSSPEKSTKKISW